MSIRLDPCPPQLGHRTMWTGDNLAIVRGMNAESVELIYLDRPFNSNRNYAAPIGSQAVSLKNTLPFSANISRLEEDLRA